LFAIQTVRELSCKLIYWTNRRREKLERATILTKFKILYANPDDLTIISHNKIKEKFKLYRQRSGMHLHLNRLAIDEFAAGDHRIEDNSCLLTRVQDDVIAFSAKKKFTFKLFEAELI
jgi:hypothetical protein